MSKLDCLSHAALAFADKFRTPPEMFKRNVHGIWSHVIIVMKPNKKIKQVAKLAAIAMFWLLLVPNSLAVEYVRSTDGNDADDGSTWALAHATLADAITEAGVGGIVYVSQAHAETQAGAMTITSPGTAASPCQVLCVNDAAEPPTALATTATVSQTGAADMTLAGYAYLYGIKLIVGSTSVQGRFLFSTPWFLDNCYLKFNTTYSGGLVFTGTAGAAGRLELNNTPIEFGAASQALAIRGPFKWTNTASAVVGTIPTAGLFAQSSTNPSIVETRGVDLSALGASPITAASGTNYGRIYLQDCKLGTSFVMATGAIVGQGGWEILAVNCDSADTNYRYYKQTYQGTITQETVIVRTGGATDGTTPISRKMVSTANSKFYSPLESQQIVFWNETVGSSVTVTIPVITDNVTLTDAEAWIEVEYLGTSGFPLASTATDRSANILATGVAQTTDSTSTWTTTGLTTPVKQSLSVSFTPQEKGLVRARVMLAKASTTMYYDPKPRDGSGRQYMIGEGGYENEGPAGISRARIVNQ